MKANNSIKKEKKKKRQLKRLLMEACSMLMIHGVMSKEEWELRMDWIDKKKWRLV